MCAVVVLVLRAGATRRISRYISQPRQKPKTALSRAAASAKPGGDRAEERRAGEVADEADQGEHQTDALGEAGRLRVLEVRRARRAAAARAA